MGDLPYYYEQSPEEREIGELDAAAEDVLSELKQGNDKKVKHIFCDLLKNYSADDINEAMKRATKGLTKEKHMWIKYSEEKLKEYPISGLDPSSAISASLDNEGRHREEADETGQDTGNINDAADPLTNNPVDLIKARLRDWIARTSRVAQNAKVSNLTGIEFIKKERQLVKDVERFYKGYDTAKQSCNFGDERFKDANLLKSIHKLAGLGIIKEDELPIGIRGVDLDKLEKMKKGAGISEDFLPSPRVEKQKLSETEVEKLKKDAGIGLEAKKHQKENLSDEKEETPLQKLTKKIEADKVKIRC